MKTIYAVCFQKYNDKHEIAYHYFDELVKAQNYIQNVSKQYKSNLVIWNKEKDLWNFKITLEPFFMDSSYHNKYDRWFINEIIIE